MTGKLVRDMALYLGATLLFGTAANFVPGRHLAWWGRGTPPPQEGVDFTWMDAGSAESLRSALPSVVFIDTRPEPVVAAGRVPGAVAVSYTDLQAHLDAELDTRLRAADAVIVYGDTDEADVEQLLAQELRLRGLAPPYILAGGFAAWEASGFPVEGSAP